MSQWAEIPGELLAHVSPLGWEHINLTGEYRWPGADRREPRNASSVGSRPLRKRPDDVPAHHRGGGGALFQSVDRARPPRLDPRRAQPAARSGPAPAGTAPFNCRPALRLSSCVPADRLS